METGKDLKIVTVTHGPTTSIMGEHLSFSIYEHQEPGTWSLTCAAARYDHFEFNARPHDIDHAKNRAVAMIGDRLKWLLSAQLREVEMMKKAIQADTKVDQPAPPKVPSDS